MNKIIDSMTIAIVAFLLCGCNQKGQDTSGKVHLGKPVEDIISTYTQDYPEYDSFLLLTETEGATHDPGVPVRRIMIGPAYRGLYSSGEGTFKTYPHMYAEINKRIIFIQSSSDFIMKDNNIKALYKSREQHPQDSVPEFPYYDYLEHGMTFLYDIKYGTVYDISRRPDTVVGKRRVEFIPPPIR